MNRKFMSMLITGTTLISMLGFIGCEKKDAISQGDTPVEIELAVDDETRYKEIGEEAVKALGEVSTQEKEDARFDAIYNAIFADKAKELISKNTITKEEAQAELEKAYIPKILTVYTVETGEDKEGEPKSYEYYKYEGSDALDIETVKSEYDGEVKVTEREATYEDNLEEARRAIASRSVVRTISEMTNKLIEG